MWQEQVAQKLSQEKAIRDYISTNKIKCRGVNFEERIYLSTLKKSGPILYIVQNEKQALKAKISFSRLGKKVEELTNSIDLVAYKMGSQQDTKTYFDIMSKLIKNDIDVLIITAKVLLQRVPSKKTILKNSENLQINTDVSIMKIVERLISLGYQKVDEIDDINQFRARGDILDICLHSNNEIVRVEFFGNTIENMRVLKLSDYSFLRNINNLNITPYCINFISFYNYCFSDCDNKDNDIKCNNICSWLKDGTIVVDDSNMIYAELEKEYSSIVEDVSERIKDKTLDKDDVELYIKPNLCKLDCFKNVVLFENVDELSKLCLCNQSVYFSSVESFHFNKNMSAMFESICNFDRQNYTVIIFASDNDMFLTIKQRLKDLKVRFKENEIIDNHVCVCLTKTGLNFGFSDFKLVCFDADKFSWNKNAKQQNIDNSRIFYLPKVNDYVVHENYGIAKCIRISKENFGVSARDYFVLQFANNSILYVPTEQTDVLSAYFGEKEPKLDDLGSNSFAKNKEKAKSSVKKLAYDLKKLYAIRESLKGYSYEISENLIKEFILSFGFELTPDQQSAVNDIIADMRNGKIMDRLICGDVGFGKTEVALVAAFIATLNLKQVVVLAPTSVLCYQHFMNFSKKLKDFGIKVCMLSRFQSAKQNNKIIEDIKLGKYDIICGTKRVLSNDVSFKDIGLLILDEEQRFGVNDKEKIKSFKKDINVLTLTATPIPRTLNMSLIGVRDISLISSPPKNRQTVQTIVCKENDNFIYTACKREMERKGQVLIVYNKVEDIINVAAHIKKMIPEARIDIAHGQMKSNQLEQIIFKLYTGEIDILVSTTLIENGVDLPSANTLIVLNADKFGLAQLHQLRGRVGRSDKNAFAYFMYHDEHSLTSMGYERLKALKEYSGLGSGFKLAMQDLYLRGAGEILGANQSGHVAKIGYDLYCKLLQEALKELEGQDVFAKKEVSIDIDEPAFIDDKFIIDENERISLYNKISQIKNQDNVKEILQSVKQLYFSVPKSIENLCFIALIKNIVQKYNVKKVSIKNKKLTINFYEINNNSLLKKLKSENFVQSESNNNIFNVNIENLREAKDKIEYTFASNLN